MGQIVRTPIVLADTVANPNGIVVSGNYILVNGTDINGNTITATLYAPGATVGGSQSTGYQAYNGGTVADIDVTPAGTASALEGFVITQINTETNMWESYTFQHMNSATGNALTTGTALAAQVTAISSKTGGGSLDVEVVSVSGGGVIALGTLNGNNVIYVTPIGVTTSTVNTPGINPVGTGAQVASLPFIQGQASVSGEYDTILFSGFNPDVNMLINKSEYAIEQTIYIPRLATEWVADGIADWKTALQTFNIIP